MTSWDEARALAWAAAAALPPVDVGLEDALGRELAEPLWALAPLPAFDTAAMDGWAVRGPGPWRVAGRTLAGDPPPPPLADGAAREVATGAAVPAACDGVAAARGRRAARRRADRPGRRAAGTCAGPGRSAPPARPCCRPARVLRPADARASRPRSATTGSASGPARPSPRW